MFAVTDLLSFELVSSERTDWLWMMDICWKNRKNCLSVIIDKAGWLSIQSVKKGWLAILRDWPFIEQIGSRIYSIDRTGWH